MTTPASRPRRRLWWLIAGAVVVAGLVGAGAFLVLRHRNPPPVALPLQQAGQMPLPGDSSRFDYAALDPQRGLLFIAHLGASEVIEADIRRHTIVRVIRGLSQVHGVIVVPAQRRVYATPTGTNELVTLDETTGTELGRASTGEYPDGLAYDPERNAVWTTNETAGSETAIDAATNAVKGTVKVGGEVGNVVYDTARKRMLVAVQSENTLAVIDPATFAVERRVPLPGCDHDHGVSLDAPAGLVFVACDGNATLLTVDINTGRTTGATRVGEDPDVLAYDTTTHRLYVAAESGWVTTLDLHGRRLVLTGRDHLGDGAHVVAADPTTGHTYYPLAAGPSGQPVLIEEAPR